MSSSHSLRLDAHQHFWRYDPASYPWIGHGMDALRRNFEPEDLRPLLDAAGLDGCIAVQARACTGETDQLLLLAERYPWIRAVVGWVDLCALNIQGGRKEGYRAWTHKQNFPGDAVGRWQVRVLTEDGQVIGVLRFKVTDSAQTDNPK